MPDRRRIAILGATGSIGRQTLDVIGDHADRFEVVAVAAHRNGDELLSLQQQTGAEYACLTAEDASMPSEAPGSWSRGAASLPRMVEACGCDVVVNAVTGAAGLAANLRAVELGIDLAIANKESLVMAGSLLMTTAAQSGSTLTPIDSEHSALLQCMRAGALDEIRRIVLTASGGPFRGRSEAELDGVLVDDALAHPTWKMGPKITIDSATLMNKALEVIEAHVLFDLPPERIDVVVHPQSIVHSLVEFHDGSTMAHVGPPDMRIPIQYALSHPERWPRPDPGFSLAEIAQLTFEPVDDGTFPAIQLAYRACNEGGSAPIVLNAANEAAVELFLHHRIPFTSISDLVEKSLDQHDTRPVHDLDEILEIDRQTRKTLQTWI